MTEPKKAKRTYEAHTDSALEGLHLVQQRSLDADNSEGSAPTRSSKGRAARKPAADSGIVVRLIEFIQKI